MSPTATIRRRESRRSAVNRALGWFTIWTTRAGVGGLLRLSVNCRSVAAAARPAIVVVFDARAGFVGPAMLRLTAGCGAEGVELSGELGL